jgi:hypothetical protein
LHILEEMDFLTENCSDVEIQNLMTDRVLSRACLKSLEIKSEMEAHSSWTSSF